MTYNYPFFSFPHFRRYPNYYQAQSHYIRKPVNSNQHIPNSINNQIEAQTSSRLNLAKENNYSRRENIVNSSKYNQYTKENSSEPKEHQKEKSFSKRTSSGFNFLNNFLHQEDRSEDEDFFELFGLKLYNDDLLLIGLIFFLYKEDVKDQYLFFALILLLLS